MTSKELRANLIRTTIESSQVNLTTFGVSRAGCNERATREPKSLIATTYGPLTEEPRAGCAVSHSLLNLGRAALCHTYRLLRGAPPACCAKKRPPPDRTAEREPKKRLIVYVILREVNRLTGGKEFECLLYLRQGSRRMWRKCLSQLALPRCPLSYPKRCCRP